MEKLKSKDLPFLVALSLIIAAVAAAWAGIMMVQWLFWYYHQASVAWWLQYALAFTACAVFTLVFGETRWKRWLMFVCLLAMSGLIFWSTQKDAELLINGDLHRVENARHIPTPDRWWRMR